MGKMMQNKNIAKVLNTQGKRNTFFKKAEKFKAGGLNERELKQVLGEVAFGTGDKINMNQSRKIGREFFKSGKWYKRPTPEVAEKPVSMPGKIEKHDAAAVEKPVISARTEKKEEVKKESAQPASQSPRRASSSNLAIPILYKKLNRSSSYLRNQIGRSNQALSKSLRNLENSSEDEDENENKDKNIFNLLNEIEKGNKE